MVKWILNLFKPFTLTGITVTLYRHQRLDCCSHFWNNNHNWKNNHYWNVLMDSEHHTLRQMKVPCFCPCYHYRSFSFVHFPCLVFILVVPFSLLKSNISLDRPDKSVKKHRKTFRGWKHENTLLQNQVVSGLKMSANERDTFRFCCAAALINLTYFRKMVSVISIASNWLWERLQSFPFIYSVWSWYGNEANKVKYLT